MPTAGSAFLVLVTEWSNRSPPQQPFSSSWRAALSSVPGWEHSKTPSVVTTAAVGSLGSAEMATNLSAPTVADILSGPYDYYVDGSGSDDGDGRSFGLDAESDVARSPGAAVAIALALTAITLVCLIGNLLVMVAVCLVRRLRTPSNYLIANLAVADWLVGLLVMPWAIAYDSLGHWPFGATLCTAWITCDVLLSTASILNLMMISVDRYLVITRPLHYAPHRGRSLMFVYAAVAWTMSLAIGLAPLVVGWRHVTHDGVCLVSQELGYQVYATVGAFYLPLTVMLALYGKVLHVSTGIAQSDLSKRRPRGSAAPTCGSASSAARAPAALSAAVGGAVPNAALSAILPAKCYRCALGGVDCKVPLSEQPIVAATPAIAEERLERRSCAADCSRVTARHSGGDSHPSDDGGEDSSGGGDRRLGSLGVGVAASGDGGSSTPLTVRDRCGERSSQPRLVSNGGGSGRTLLSGSRRCCDWRCWGSARLLRRCRSRHRSHAVKRVGGESRAAPSKAVVTLGIIMGGFVLFWLPFFIVALIRPFCGESCSIPLWVQSVLTWLGYVNSCLNPIVYIRFNREYRTPFKEILLLRCRTLQAEVRREDYRHRYGTLNKQQRSSKPAPAADFTAVAAAAGAAAAAAAPCPIVAWV